QVERQTNFTFFFGNVKINKAQRFTLNASNQKLSDVLRELSKKTGFSFKQVNYSIGVFKKDQPRQTGQDVEIFIQGREVTGVITDENGSPLPGASILIKGTNHGTVSDVTGRYRIEAPEDAVLVISF